MGALDGLRVLDLSWGVAGPAATMLLADNGADVTRVERPAGDPFDGWLDYRVYHRGKRSAVLDLKDPADHRRFLALADAADVLVESFRPGVTARLGIDEPTLRARNPRLVYCSITGYGPDTSLADRPAYDQLVAARLGFQWQVRAWPGSPRDAEAGVDLFGPDTDVPAKVRRWLDRGGPVFTATPAASANAAYLATLGIVGALRARLHTGRGQHVQTSLLQGVIANQGSSWQRTEHPLPGKSYMLPIMDHSTGVTIMSGAWCFYECADGRWVNNWTSPPEWAIVAGAGDALRHPDQTEVRALIKANGGRQSSIEAILRVRAQAEPVFRKFPQAEWVRLAAEAGVALQPVRSPEEVLTDPALFDEGSTVDVVDPDLGLLRQPGLLVHLHGTPGHVRGAAPRRGEHTDAVRAEADVPAAVPSPDAPSDARLAGPLAGVVALDFGLAVAGPWGGELLAQLGAEVIKIDPPKQNGWLSTHMAAKVNRSKPHLSLDVKTPQGERIVQQLVRQADVVLMNMRPQAAAKLGLDHDSIRAIKPSIVYCHTAGYDHTRAHLPGNDQTGNAVGGTEWEDGGISRGGRPYWSAASGGDLGNGYLSAIGMVQALFHKERTGEGQAVDTHILNASMFSSGRVYTTPDGRRFDRPTMHPDLVGFSALYRLYECASGWLCVAVFGESAWTRLVSVVPALAGDARFADAGGRAAHDDELADVLAAAFATDTAATWFERLDAAGVPCEVSALDWAEQVLDDPELREREWIVSRPGHLVHGRMEMFGRVVDFSDTPSTIKGPPAVPGQHSRAVLRRFGFTDDEIDGFVADGAVFEAAPAGPAAHER